MGETPVGSAHYHALFFAGLLLLLITLTINLISAYIERKGAQPVFSQARGRRDAP
jgi:phosphate transport system permease protein